MSDGAGQEPIRVCFPFVGDDVGGSHISALKLIQNLDRSRVETVLVLQEPTGPLATFLQRQRQPFTRRPPSKTLPAKGTTLGDIANYLTTTLPCMRRFIREQRL